MRRGRAGQPALGEPIAYNGELLEDVKQGKDSSEFKLLSGYSGCRVRAELEGYKWVTTETSCVAVGASYTARGDRCDDPLSQIRSTEPGQGGNQFFPSRLPPPTGAMNPDLSHHLRHLVTAFMIPHYPLFSGQSNSISSNSCPCDKILNLPHHPYYCSLALFHFVHVSN